ncbi:MAG: hypothetical protein V2A76_17595, partial [Planctomycetota bacterium]
MIDLDAVAVAANELAPLPMTASRLAAILGRERIDAGEITEVVSFDPTFRGIGRGGFRRAAGSTTTAAAADSRGLGRLAVP